VVQSTGKTGSNASAPADAGSAEMPAAGEYDPGHNPFAAGDAKYEAKQAGPATRIYCDHAAAVIPETALAGAPREALASMTDWVVDVKALVRQQVMIASLVPTVREADTWASERGQPSPAAKITKYSKVKVATHRALDLALKHGLSPAAHFALSDIMASDRPWVEAVVELFRDVATINKRKRWGGDTWSIDALTLSPAVPVTDLLALPCPPSKKAEAASLRIIASWESQDWEAARKPPAPPATITLTKAADVERRHVDWLWTTENLDPYSCAVSGALIPLHGLTLIGGREQAAKSTFLWWLATQITRGTLPGHYFGAPRDVVIFATEATEHLIRLRLEVAGADLHRVHFPAKIAKDDGTALSISIKDDIGLLSAMLESIEPGAMFFDPLKDFMGGADTNSEDEVRGALVPLLDLTATHDCAVIGLIHLVKSVKGDFLARLAGSGAFKNVPRAVLGVAHDEITDTRVLQQKKNNDAVMARGAFLGRVESVSLTFGGRTEKVGRWVMDGHSPHSLDTVLAMQEQGGRPPTAAERAETFLLDHLDDGAPHPYEEIKTAADKLKIAETTLKRARAKIGATSTREKVKGAGTVWQLPGADEDQTPSLNGMEIPAPTVASRARIRTGI